MNSDCRFYRERMGALLVADLDPQEEQGLRRHLESCQECATERDRLSETLEHLGSLEAAPLPHPFFVPPPAQASNPWQLSKRLPRRWQAALASTVLALILLGALSLAGLEVRLEDGTFHLAFAGLSRRAAPESLDEARLEELTLAVLEAVDQRLAVRDRAMAEAVRAELSSLRSDLEGHQSSVVATALDRHREQLEQRWLERSGAFESGVRDFVVLSYDHFSHQYRSDFQDLASELDEFARDNVLREHRMELLSNAVLEIAGLPPQAGHP